jgi:hypothetical protein
VKIEGITTQHGPSLGVKKGSPLLNLIRRHYDQGLSHAEGRAATQGEPIIASSGVHSAPTVPELMPVLRGFEIISPPLKNSYFYDPSRSSFPPVRTGGAIGTRDCNPS